LTFGLLFTIILVFREKNFDLSTLLTGIVCQIFFFGHAYFIIPGKHMEDALGVMMAMIPIFVLDMRMWYFVVTNTILFHIAFLTAGYGDVFYFKYIFYVVLFMVIHTITKINEQYEMEIIAQRDQITKDAAQLKELDGLKNRFFANITHELRTPLTLILSPVQSILRSKELSDQNATFLQLVQQNGQKLLQRINELLELSKLDAKRLTVKREPTNIHQFCRQILSLHEGSANSKGIQLSFENAIPAVQQLLLDPTKLELILSNYLSNAIKFTPQNGLIKLSIEREREVLTIRVQDTGIGIREAELDKIFERFYQVQQENNLGGSGIGLSLCKELAELQGGNVRVESEVGKGSIFYLQLPYVESKAIGNTPQNREVVRSESIVTHTEPQRDLSSVLIVEDNYDMREYMKLLLSEKYQVIAAENGKIALEYLQAYPRPAVIISDIMMPEMDGMQLLNILRSDDVLMQIPVIMLTAQNSAAIKINALRIGVDDYITKPFNGLELLTRVSNLIDNSQNRGRSEAEEKLRQLPTISKSDLLWLEKVEQIIVDNISDSKFTLKDAAASLNISYNGFQQKIKKITGLPPKQYQRSIKLHKAREILKSGEVETVSEVLYQLGFENHYYFSKTYQQEFGIMPSDELKCVQH